MVLGDAAGVPAVYFTDGAGVSYALNAATGKKIWEVKTPGHWSQIATGAPTFYKGVMYQPFASFEEATAADPKTPCCSFRGNVVALDAATGK